MDLIEIFNEKLKKLTLEKERQDLALEKAKKNPKTQKKREEYERVKKQRQIESEMRRETKADEERLRKQRADERRQAKEEKIKNEELSYNQRKEEFALAIKSKLLDSVKTEFAEDFKNPEFLRYALTIYPNLIYQFDDAKQIFNLSFAKEYKDIFLNNLGKIRKVYGTIPTIKFMNYLFNSKEGSFIFQDLYEHIDSKELPYLIWATVCDKTNGIVRMKDFVELDDDQKMILLQNPDFFKENYERFLTANKRFAKALPRESISIPQVEGYFKYIEESDKFSDAVKKEMKGIYQFIGMKRVVKKTNESDNINLNL